jgi:alpha-tubulin suppressor-like RCC1 family protein
MQRPSALLRAAILAATLSACGGPGTEPHLPASHLSLVSGNQQSAAVGHALAASVVVRVTDDGGRPVPGQSVTFVVTSGGGSVGVASVIAGSDGLAQATWTLGHIVTDSQALEARASVGGTALTAVLFTAHANPGPPAAITAASPTDQNATAGIAVPQSPAVHVGDQYGNAVPGVTVTFAVTSGNGALTGATPMTDANGNAAAASWTLGPLVALNKVSATVGSLAPLTFSALGQSGPAAHIVKVAGDSQTVTVNTIAPAQPTVLVTDAGGNPVGAVVTFTVTAGGGLVLTTGQPLVTGTGSDGKAQTPWKMGRTAGAQALTVSVGALSVTFNATAIAGLSTAVTVIAGDSQVSVLNSPVPVLPRVRVTDAFGNPKVGVTVTFTGSGVVSGGSPVTDASGFASVGSWTLDAPGMHYLFANTADVGQAGDFRASAMPAQLGSIYAGAQRTCASAASGGFSLCWGEDANGSIGDGLALVLSLPDLVQSATALTAFTLAATHSCALGTNGTAYCWGLNTNPCCANTPYGLLGTGSNTPIVSATPVAVVGGTYTAVSASPLHSCGIAAGSAYCWGNEDSGRLGNGATGSTTNQNTPTLVNGALTWNAITTGDNHSCGLSNGAAYCWGLGFGATPSLVGGGLVFTAISAGGAHTCALDGAGAAFCWGSNASGALGDGSTQTSAAPVPVSGGLAFATIDAGGAHTCGLTVGGVAYCWGDNSNGQLGDNSQSNRLAPVPVSMPAGVTFAAISAGDNHSCALSTTGVVFCWGSNNLMQLGIPRTTRELVPRRVSP